MRSVLKRCSKYEGVARSSVSYLHKRKSEYSRDLLRSQMNENTFVDSFSLIFRVIFATLTENSSVVKNDCQGPREDLHHRNQLQGHTSTCDMALKLLGFFYVLMEKPLDCYFQVLTPLYLTAQETEPKKHCILKVTSQTRECQKTIRININHSYHQRLSP